ncbi:unnamed protein product [Zymoseptoria tritici ST99CH_1A5]|uniref:Uncharacterized protein n=3 Tax=Zymoseptoria tritici TaxID=1047171 RepID=A0A2H1GYZ6_ZYMTR|nr:unnamed protein product [Zymoseptoria tritici ST99CH_1E4]SMR61783.1 unnamed protein product [Zymoseptoria tritici ST99CH_3D1]SMY28005.1 unnamed protein product [Zymoseptoria tritici ST99CH_1A5]
MMNRITRSTARSLRSRRFNPTTTNSASRCLATKTSSTTDESSKDDKKLEENATKAATTQKSTLTVAERDAEIQRKLAGISGDGGASGVEYEDGKPAAMKRSVKNNMFRLI